jgi:hypothetical protein
MSRIKSALELALEKTETVHIDKAAMQAHELKQEAKRITSLFLNDPDEVDLEQKIKNFPKENQAAAADAAFEVLLTNLSLPSGDASLVRLAAIKKGVEKFCKDRRASMLMEQLAELYRQYMEDLKNLDSNCRKQYAPRLRQKEEALSKRMGQMVRIDPMQDPDFLAFLNGNLKRLREKYDMALAQARDQLRQFYGAGPFASGQKAFR